MKYTTHAGAMPSIQVNDLRVLSMSRWRLALQRCLALIQRGAPLRAVDSNTIGDKYTTCSWGMCGDEPTVWPDAEDHVWPISFEERGRVAPLSWPEGQMCPMDTRTEDTGNGCFYSCRVFQAKRGQRPTRDEAIALFERRIAEVSAAMESDA